MRGFQRYVLAGLATAIPLLVTWVVFDFVFGLLARFGTPAIRWLSSVFETREGILAAWLLDPWSQWILAIILTILGLYLLGFAASRVVGRRLIALLDTILARLPFIEKVYGATKRLVEVMQTKPEKGQLVVLIEFPHEGMKALGLVTRVITEKGSGQELAVVYVPTTPNPTSGYLEFVPLDKVTPTNLTFDEAISFIVTGGAIGPDSIAFLPPDRPMAEALRERIERPASA